MSKIEFQQGKVDEARKAYESLKLEPIQREIIEAFSKIIVKYVSMNELALRGFMLFVLRDWQKKSGKPATIITKMNPEERIKTMKELFADFYQKLSKILVNSEDKERLKKSLDEAFDFYVKNYAYRKSE